MTQDPATGAPAAPSPGYTPGRRAEGSPLRKQVLSRSQGTLPPRGPRAWVRQLSLLRTSLMSRRVYVRSLGLNGAWHTSTWPPSSLAPCFPFPSILTLTREARPIHCLSAPLWQLMVWAGSPLCPEVSAATQGGSSLPGWGRVPCTMRRQERGSTTSGHEGQRMGTRGEDTQAVWCWWGHTLGPPALGGLPWLVGMA